MLTRFLLIGLALGSLSIISSCDTKDANLAVSPEMKENSELIRNKTNTYVEAMNARDIDTAVNLWSDNAVYKNPFNGELVNGREGIRSEFKNIFSKNDKAKVKVNIKSIRFPIEEKAVEEGTATITIPGQKPMESDFKMIYVNEDGEWMILHVSQLGFGLEGN